MSDGSCRVAGLLSILRYQQNIRAWSASALPLNGYRLLEDWSDYGCCVPEVALGKGRWKASASRPDFLEGRFRSAAQMC